jgi:hypothetical protein
MYCINHQSPSHLNDSLQMAIEEQTQIGWHQLILGYMSKKWLWPSSMDTSKMGHLNLLVRQSRKHSVLKAMTLMVCELWLERNEVLHQHKDDKDHEIYSMESAELCHYHSNPNLIQSSHQCYCRNMTLNKLLQSKPSVCHRWLKQVETARAAFLKDERINDAHSADKGCTHDGRDQTIINNHIQCTTQKHKHDTATDDSILPWSTRRHLNRNIPKSFALSTIELRGAALFVKIQHF